jgi:hypothetical protein
MNTKQSSLNHTRIATMTLLLISFFSTVSLFARVAPHNVIGSVAAFVAGVLVTPIIASPIEWLVHRYVYHRSFCLLRRIYAVHLAHHHLYFPTWRYVTGGPARRIPILGHGVNDPQISKWRNAATYFAHFVFYMVLGAVFIWIPARLASQSVFFLAGTISGTIVISNLFIIVHDAIHRPGSHRIMETQAWFCFLDKHHYIHHVDTEANVNFLLPLADWLFGTLRKHLTDEELAKHGTMEAAKSHVIGIGEPANETSMYGQRIMSVVAETA